MSSASESSASSLSITPSPGQKKNKSGKDRKGKKKKDSRKNEGIDRNWAYAPPPGAILIEEDVDADAGEFDWDKINDDDDLELCLIRIPESVKPKSLQHLQLQMPISSTKSQSTRVGVLKRKHTTFDIWSVGLNDGEQPVGGEEMKSLSCLLPRKKKKGDLYPAPKPFTHHLLLSAQSVLPTPCTDATQASTSSGLPYQNPPRQAYPTEVLKHQFMPYGSLVNVTDNNNEMDTDTRVEEKMVMNVDIEPPETQPTVTVKAKRKRGKTVDETPLLAPTIKPSPAIETEPEGKKAKKRRTESTGRAETPAPKRSKKSKT